MIYDFIKKGDLVFDVGANRGAKSKMFLERGAKVIAFEPQKQCLDELSKLDVVVENVALSNKVEKNFLFQSTADTLSSMSDDFIDAVRKERFPNYEIDRVTPIFTETLDNMILKYGKPNFIKIDVEGYELEVLKGLTQKIDCISIEFTPELCQKTLECLDYLPEGLYNYGSQEDDTFWFDEWITKKEMVEFLKNIDDYKVEFGDVYIK